MAQQTINVGAAPNDGTGTPLRTAFQYTNSNFTELYTALGGGSGLPGASGQLIFNNGTSLAGDNELFYNATTNTLTTEKLIVPGNTQVATVGTLYVGTILNPKLKVDVAGTGETTIASATITGAANFNGGALAAYLNGSLLVGSSANVVNLYAQSSGLHIKNNTGTFPLLTVNNSGDYTFQDGAGGTRMTLNATGLGVGGAPLSGFRLNVNNGDFRVSDVQNEDGVEIGWSLGAGNGFVQAYNRTTSAFKDLVLNNAVTINTAGNLGIGVTPSAWNSAIKAVQSSRSSIASNGITTWFGSNVYYDSTYTPTYIANEYAGALAYNPAGFGGWAFYTASAGTGTITGFATAKMTLDESGNLLVGTTGLNGSWNTKLTLSNDSGTTKWAVGPYLGGVTNFLISAGASAGVYLNGTAATSWTSASDERLKDIIEPISNAIAKVGSLRAVIGKFKFDENNTRKPFLIAQDIQAVLPEAVDASNPDKLGVAYTDVIPLLVAAIKELTAEVNALKNA